MPATCMDACSYGWMHSISTAFKGHTTTFTSVIHAECDLKTKQPEKDLWPSKVELAWYIEIDYGFQQ